METNYSDPESCVGIDKNGNFMVRVKEKFVVNKDHQWLNKVVTEALWSLLVPVVLFFEL